MYNTSSLDTSILTRLIVHDAPAHYKKAVKLLARENQTFFIEDVAIIELVHVLETIYRYTRLEVTDGLKLIFAFNNISANTTIFEKVMPLYLAHPKLSFNDCYLAVMAEHKSAEPLWTFDKKLAAQLPSPKLA